MSLVSTSARLGCFTEVLEENKILKAGNIFVSLWYILFHWRQDAPCSRLGFCCSYPVGTAPLQLCATWLRGSKGGGEEPTKAGLGSEMKPLSVVFFHPKGKVNSACLCVQKVAPAARACRQLLLVRRSRADAATPLGNTLANPGSQPP